MSITKIALAGAAALTLVGAAGAASAAPRGDYHTQRYDRAHSDYGRWNDRGGWNDRGDWRRERFHDRYRFEWRRHFDHDHYGWRFGY